MAELSEKFVSTPKNRKLSIDLQWVQQAKLHSSLHSLHTFNTSIMGLQCVQRTQATELSTRIACL